MPTSRSKRTIDAAYRRRHPKRILLKQARSRAQRGGIPFDLTEADIHIPHRCPVLGIPLKRAEGQQRQADTSPTLDRVDNTKGYVKGNVIVVSWRANRLKGDADMRELERVASFYAQFLQ